MSYAPLSTTSDAYSPPSTPPPRQSYPSLPSVRSPTTSFTPSRGKVDLRSIEEGFSRWVDVVRAKGKGKGRKRRKSRKPEGERETQLMESVFAAESSQVSGSERLANGLGIGHEELSHEEFLDLVGSVRDAMSKNVHPKLIAKGSSGSYFARDEDGHVVGVFKPKDEEPYGRLNPKWTKWVHRNFFSWIGWGRACLIPNLSYVSEAAASELDRRLGLGMVPRTELVSLSSPAFFYDWIDRSAYSKSRKPLRDKIGSFQTFMHGFKDATEWLKEHPWPGLSYDDQPGRTHHLTRCITGVQLICGRAGATEWDENDDEEENQREDIESRLGKDFRWTSSLKADFWEQLQRLIVLDFIMRNTDRGLDNFMIRYDPGSPTPRPSTIISSTPGPNTMNASRASRATDSDEEPRIRIAAIDNSLSFPHVHPLSWRSYLYGWLFLPVSLIGQPFSNATREHLIPLLSSPVWWEETLASLRAIFELDADFNEKLWQRQVSVMKGQGFTLLESLKHHDEGPLELCRRDRYEVHEELLEVADNAETSQRIAVTMGRTLAPSSSGPPNATTLPSAVPPTNPFSPITPAHVHPPPPATPTRPVPHRSHSIGSPRSSLDEAFRPVPFSGRVQETYNFAGATGVEVIDALEKVDKAERRLMKLKAGADEEHDDGEGYPLRGGAFSDGEDEESRWRKPDGKRHRRRQPSLGARSLGGIAKSGRGKSHRSHSSTSGVDLSLKGIVESAMESGSGSGSRTPVIGQPLLTRPGKEPSDESVNEDLLGDLTRSVASLPEAEEGAKGKHGRWSSDFGTMRRVEWGEGDDEEGEGEGGEEQGKMRWVRVERLKKIPGQAFFSGW